MWQAKSDKDLERDVRDELAFARGDVDLAKAVADSLSWNVEVPHGKIKTSVRDGWVTVEGTVPKVHFATSPGSKGSEI